MGQIDQFDSFSLVLLAAEPFLWLVRLVSLRKLYLTRTEGYVAIPPFLKRFISGDDLGSHPDQSPFVITMDCKMGASLSMLRRSCLYALLATLSHL